MRKVWVLLAVFLLAASAPGAALADVVISPDNFPDNTFIIFVREHDTNKDGFLSLAEIEAAKSMTVKPDFGAKNLVGIEYFTYLETLVCAKQELTSLDMRWNAKLKDLHCETNDLLTALNVRENTELTSLHCENTPLTELDVSKNTKLTWLSCYENRLTELDVSKNTALTDLACASNDLTALDVRANPNLRNLDCSNNDLKALDVSQNTALSKLECRNDRLTSLDLSQNTKLMYLYCEQNQLTSLDVSKNTALSTLHCQDNRLTALDLSQNEELSTLNCTDNRLTALDLSQNTRLDALYCKGNRLTFLDLQGLPLTGGVTVGGQTRDGLTVSAIGGAYVVDLGAFLSPDRFVKVKDLAGKDSGGAPLNPQSFLNGKATFTAKPVTVTYRYDTGNDKATSMDVTLIVANAITVSVSGRGRVTRKGSTEALSGNVAVSPGSDATFMVLADEGYEIAYLRVDNALVSGASGATHYEYPFPNVTANHTLRAVFKVKSPPTVQFTIKVAASGHGRVTCKGSTEALSGDVAVPAGSDATFAISADAGYEIADLRIDNAPVSVPSGTARYEYPFPNVAANHTLRAAFKVKSPPTVQFTIKVAASGHGRVTCKGSTEALSGDVAVPAGSDATFVILADAGYEIAYLRVDNAPASVRPGTARYEHPFPNVAADHRLETAFKVRSAPPDNPPAPPVNPPAPPTSPDVPPDNPPAPPVNPPAPPTSPDVPPTSPDVPPTSPDVPPTSPDVPPAPPVNPPAPAGSGSGGGCDAGVSGLALTFAAAFLLKKKA